MTRGKEAKRQILTAQMMSLQMINSSKATLADIAPEIFVQGLFHHDCGC
jgi:hypothetical protein